MLFTLVLTKLAVDTRLKEVFRADLLGNFVLSVEQQWQSGLEMSCFLASTWLKSPVGWLLCRFPRNGSLGWFQRHT